MVRFSTFTGQGKLKSGKGPKVKSHWSSCACRHVISGRSHGLSAISGDDQASHANRAVMGDAIYPERGSKSMATRFRAVWMGLLGLDLPVAVVRELDTTMPHSSDIPHLSIVS